MELSRKRKNSTPSNEDERGIDLEDPQEGCSQQVNQTKSAIRLPKTSSCLHGLQNQWRRFAEFLKNKKNCILKKGRQLLRLDHPNNTTETGCQSSTKAVQTSGFRKRERADDHHGTPSKRAKIESATKKSNTVNVTLDEAKRQGGSKRLFIDCGSDINEYLQPGKKAKLDSECSDKERIDEGAKATVPLTVDKFTFQHVLGEGTFGMVMLATDSIRREQVAIKAIKKKSLLQYKEGFAEGTVLQMAQESIVLVHGYGAFNTRSHVYFVMELVTGGTLCDLVLEKKWLSLCTIKFLVAEIVCGIQFLHSKGIAHRDLKSDNILLTSQGHIKITDFGLAMRMTAEDNVHGSPVPEIITGKPYVAAEDWHALGTITMGLVACLKPAEMALQVQNQETSEQPDPATIDLVTGLLCHDRSLRLGMRGNIREHAFFSSINWDELESGKVESPLEISKKSMDEYVTRQIPAPRSGAKEEPNNMKYQALFQKVPFVCPAWSTHYHSAPAHQDPAPV